MLVYKQSTYVFYASFFLKTLTDANSYKGQCTELLSDENSQISLSLIYSTDLNLFLTTMQVKK